MSNGLSDPTQPSRRWWHVNWKALLCTLGVCGAGLAWLAVQIHHKRLEREVAAALAASGGKVTFRGGNVFRPASRITVQLSGGNATDAGLVNLQQITWLENLTLKGDKITDSSLKQLKGLESIGSFHSLGVFDSQVTVAGLAHLRNLPIKSLLIRGNRISKPDLAQLAELVGLTIVSIYDSELTDADLVHLKGLSRLRTLNLFWAQVTDQGVDGLRAALPNCEIKVWRASAAQDKD